MGQSNIRQCREGSSFALSACQQPEELARILADQLDELLSFDHLDLVVFKENPKEIEWHAWGKGPLVVLEPPVEELPTWQLYDSLETLLVGDWNTDERFPRLKQLVAKAEVDIGSVVRVPLTTPHRRMGTLGIASRPGTTYRTDDIRFLRLIARVVALAIEDGVNLRKAQQAQAELQRQNDRLQLLLNLTNRITSNLELRELLRAISANIREVMHGDVVAISLPDAASGHFRVFAMDFPRGKGVVREELLLTQPAKEVLDTVKPVVVDWREREGFPSAAYAIAAAEGVKLSCIIPLVNHGRVLGRLSISRRTETSFTPEDVEFLSQVPGQIAIAVENALRSKQLSTSIRRFVKRRSSEYLIHSGANW
jgi:formate hydrogenlyase transcriptional activator